MINDKYQSGKIGEMVHFIAQRFNLDPIEVKAHLVTRYPELKDKTHCANCGESMAIYTYSITYLDVRLLCSMADIITKRMLDGKTFTEANKIHLSSEIKDYTLISRQTITSKLGLIAKVIKRDGSKETHDRKSGWVITKRGFDFLRGEEVPRMVNVFHNRIQEHFDQMVTMKEVLSSVNNMQETTELSRVAGVFINQYQNPTLI